MAISAAKQPEILHVPLVAINDLLSESPNSIFGTRFFLWETMNSLQEPINLFVYLIKSKLHTRYKRTCLLMRKQCFMFMLLLAASRAVMQELYLDERTMPHLYVIVSRIYGSYTRVISS